mgnify:CR=1 FL=1
MAKLTRVRQKMKKGHRAKKGGRVIRPLDVAQPNNHAARFRRTTWNPDQAEEAQLKEHREWLAGESRRNEPSLGGN